MGFDRHSVLILGAGINGAAFARELVLNQVPVCLVDTADLAFGATAYSSRLIHGGLRYLEYGETDLVRESLAERARLLRLAPQFVHPLELFIPVGNRFGGLARSAARFLRLERWEARAKNEPRGLWLVRAGLWLYDRFARDPTLPHHALHHAGSTGALPVNAQSYRWLCSYYDAQIPYVERFVVALIEDARQAAAANGTEFQFFNYHRATLHEGTVEVTDADGGVQARFEPAAIVNATGAWVDETLQRMKVPSRRLMGGTKGSHIVTAHAGLREALAGRGIYAEAADGRPVFVLPLGNYSLIGTTDLEYDGEPAAAVASPEELQYLLATVNHILPGIGLHPDDITLHYCGVRPLPYSGPAAPAAVTRRHWLEENQALSVPLYSVIGGKLTTCRSLAEQAATKILDRSGRPRIAGTTERTIPGGENYPADAVALRATLDRLAERFGLALEQVRAIWPLLGTRTETILGQLQADWQPDDVIAGTQLPRALVRWIIRHEWVRRLGDLVERRLMLLYDPRLSRASLVELTRLLVAAGLLPESEVERAVDEERARLHQHFGKRLAER